MLFVPSFEICLSTGRVTKQQGMLGAGFLTTLNCRTVSQNVSGAGKSMEVLESNQAMADDA